jgi:hypothetical protein
MSSSTRKRSSFFVLWKLNTRLIMSHSGKNEIKLVLIIALRFSPVFICLCWRMLYVTVQEHQTFLILQTNEWHHFKSKEFFDADLGHVLHCEWGQFEGGACRAMRRAACFRPPRLEAAHLNGLASRRWGIACTAWLTVRWLMLYIQGVPGERDKTAGGCSLC